jgi:Tol biopolymer transport system component
VAVLVIAGPKSPVAGSPGEWVVFSSARSGEGDVYAVDPASGETVLVVGTAAPEGTVRYDSARHRIVYHRYEENRTVLMSGGDELFVDPNGDVAPAWSPDGKWIVYAAERGGQVDLFRASPDGSGEHRLTHDAFVDRYPAWSPDGARIVYARRLESGWDLHLFTPNEGAPVIERLTEGGGYAGHPAWSPDGRRIAFDILVDGQAEIAMIDASGGEVTLLTRRAGNDLVPAWSGDGRRIVFSGDPGNAGNWDVWMLDIESRDVVRLTTHEGYDGGGVFVPASVIRR